MAQGIKVIKPTKQQLEQLSVDRWSPWSCEVSSFDWSYEGTETCYFHEGRVTVTTADGSVDFGAGDLVQFADGLSCRWEVKVPVRKVYSFDVDDMDD
jgi:uncharacterized cupin superfamily protein